MEPFLEELDLPVPRWSIPYPVAYGLACVAELVAPRSNFNRFSVIQTCVEPGKRLSGGRWPTSATLTELDSDRSISASRAARILLALGVCAYIGFYLYWAIHNYVNLGTYGFDLGIHDQATWLLSRGHWPFVTISGNNYFGDHLSWIMFVLVPFYWIVPSAKVLFVAQALALGLAAVPAFLVARLKLRSEWLACGIAWVYFLNPYIGWANIDQFHPDVFEVPLIFLAFLFAMRRRWRLFFVMVVLAMLVKEDVPLLVLGIGVWVAVLYNRRIGIRTAALSALWLFVNFRFLLPTLSGTGSLANYVSIHGGRIPFGGLGGFVRTLVTKPWRVVSAFFGGGRSMYYLQVFGPLGFIPFLSPSTLGAVILPLVANGLSTFGYQHMLKYHYGTLVVPGLLVAAVFGLAHGSSRVRKVLVCLMLVTAMVGLWLWGPVPGSRDPGAWEQYPASYVQAVHSAMDLIPSDAVVSADYRFVTQVDHRVEVYEFPNPWYLLNWGGGPSTGKSLTERVARVEYVLVSRILDERSHGVLNLIMASGDFEIVFDRDNVLLLRRSEPAARLGPVRTGA